MNVNTFRTWESESILQANHPVSISRDLMSMEKNNGVEQDLEQGGDLQILRTRGCRWSSPSTGTQGTNSKREQKSSMSGWGG